MRMPKALAVVVASHGFWRMYLATLRPPVETAKVRPWREALDARGSAVADGLDSSVSRTLLGCSDLRI